MSNGKFAKRKGVATKAMVMILAVMLIVGISVGGTLAWLTAQTQTVTNTFTVGDINILLTETYNTDTDNNGKNDAWQAKLIPGTTYAKDPVVTVKANSEDCYLFVKFEEINNPSTYLTYTSLLTSPDWTKLAGVTGVDNVWYRVVNASTTDQSWPLLKDNQVAVKETIVKGNPGTDEVVMPTATPELRYTAYAVQKDNISDAAAAWAKVNP